MPEVPAIVTPLSPVAMRDALRVGHLSALGELPSYNRLAVGWAQCQLETGRGGAVWNYNLGNLKCPPSCQANHDWIALPGDIGTEPREQQAYPSAVEGSAAYWRLIARRWPAALDYFDAGNPREAMFALYSESSPSYFTAPPDAYAQTVAALYTEFVSRWPSHQYDPASATGEPGPSKTPTLLYLAMAATGVGVAWWAYRTL